MDKLKFSKEKLIQLGAYVLIVSVAVYAFWENGNQQEKNDVSRCETAIDNRTVQRNLVVAITNLGLSLTGPEENLTARQKKGRRLYIIQLNTFKNNQLSKIQPSEFCDELGVVEDGR